MSARPSPQQLRYEQLVVDFANELRREQPNWPHLERIHTELIGLERILFPADDEEF